MLPSNKPTVEIYPFLAKLKAAFPEYQFKLEWQGMATMVIGHWARIFIQFRQPHHSAISLGRINFQPADPTHHYIYGIHHYKPLEYEYEAWDDIFYQFDTWLLIDRRVPIAQLVEPAKAIRARVIAEKTAWRDAHPKKNHRKPLDPNWMGEFRKLVSFEMARAIDQGGPK